MFQKTQIIITIGIAIAFFVLGYAFSFLIKINPVSENNTYQAGWNAAKKRLAETGFAGPIMAGVEIKNISGEIKEINGNKINIKIRPFEPLADEALDVRVVAVDSATKIYKLIEKNPKEYTAELNAYNKKRKASEPIILPDSFKKVEISISDLKVGDVVIAVAEKDIKEVKEFTAVEIALNKPTAPIVAPVATTTAPAPNQ